MPVKQCRSDGKPGFRWGETGSCYTFEAGDDAGKNAAKKKALRQAIAAGASRSDLAADLDAAGIRLLAEAAEELQTEDIGEVEVLAVGGPINGVGSPPGGEYATADRIAEIAANTRALEEELKPYLKLGHSREQRALADANLLDDGAPSAGRLRNFRLSDDKTKVLADLKRVPKLVARLLRVGAFTRLSAELHRLAEQGGDGDGEERLVIKGVALLGARTPAVRTLDDIVKLYEDQEIDDEEIVATADRKLAEPDSWSRFFDEGSFVDGEAQGIVALPLATFRELAEKNAKSADTRPMPDLTLTDEAQRELATTLELGDDEELTPERLLEAVKAAKETKPPGDGGDGDGDGDGDGNGERSLEQKEFERRLQVAEKDAKETKEELRLEKRRSFVEDFVLGSGRAQPGQRQQIESMYDADAEAARKFFEGVSPDEDLAREFGSDSDDGPDEEEQKAEEETDKKRIAREYNIPEEQVI